MKSLLLLLLVHTACVSSECFFGEMEVVRNGETVCERDPSFLSVPRVIGCIGPAVVYIPRHFRALLGKKVYECQDRMNGKDVELVEMMNEWANCENGRLPDDEWIDNNHFKYRCAHYGEIEFVACITPDGTEIPDGQVRQVGPIEVICQRFNNGTVVMEATKNARDYECKTLTGETKKYGDVWVEKETFGARCIEYGRVQYLGCNSDYFSDFLTFERYYPSANTWYFCSKKGAKYTLDFFDPDEQH